MTSPVINNAMLFGAVLCYVSMIFYGMDSRFVVSENIPMMCSVSINIPIRHKMRGGVLFLINNTLPRFLLLLVVRRQIP